MGMSAAIAAREAGIRPETWKNWERKTRARQPSSAALALIERLLAQ
jgi:DNA-binding transcriptional regulator YiaG